ncbi:amino acid ABC transporter permease [Haloechinothrix halophila]|uniref:amino acid ABC transporter permease n=1 Tax=Haloechinothrix halophila TaxID=1069073 RepID=UPI00041F5CF8|nr:amino acid ABC transporter permease [Haloechinothrix halophila]
MDEYLPELLARLADGFAVTLRMLGWSALIAGIVGTILAAMRVSPVPPLRAFGTSYVNIFRNTPLVVLFLLAVEGLPTVGVRISFEWFAIITLATYTASFVCEAIRSGINTVDVGQAEASRSIGMTFGQSLGIIVLPQAIRAVIPPLASVYIALAKNTAVAAAFGVVEATGQLSNLIRDFASFLWFSFFGIAAGYVIIVLVISGIAGMIERRLAVVR